MELHGVTGAPYKHPEVRKKLPAPYSRPSITIGAAREKKRAWRDTAVTDLKPGDMVANIGVVASIEEHIRIRSIEATEDDDGMAGFWIFRVTNVVGRVFDLPGYERHYAFTEDDDDTNE